VNFFGNLLELVAAFSGFYYLKKYPDSSLRYFVYFLVITVFVDAVGSYTNFNFIRPERDTLFYENFWLYNTYVIVSLFFYITFYYFQIQRKNLKNVVKFLVVISSFVITYIIYHEGEMFFKTNLKYLFICTTFSVFLCVAFYFYEVLMSDKILVFYRSALFYISIGLLLWWLIFPLLIFYMPYFKEIYPGLVRKVGIILVWTNIYLYGCYTFGFLWGKE